MHMLWFGTAKYKEKRVENQFKMSKTIKRLNGTDSIPLKNKNSLV